MAATSLTVKRAFGIVFFCSLALSEVVVLLPCCGEGYSGAAMLWCSDRLCSVSLSVLRALLPAVRSVSGVRVDLVQLG